MKILLRSQDWRRQRGATAVEFALVSTLFFTLLIGMMEMGRILFYWNTASEATRLGARIAAVCDIDDTDIKAKMTNMLSLLPASSISVTYDPSGCTIDTCRYVTVKVQSVTVPTLIPLIPLNLSMPDFSTTLPRESLQSTVGGTANPMCN